MSLCRCLQVMYNDISNRIIGFCLESNFALKTMIREKIEKEEKLR